MAKTAPPASVAETLAGQIVALQPDRLPQDLTARLEDLVLDIAGLCLAARKTDLIDKFISKGGKPFAAYLVMDDKGKVTFEFPPREGEMESK